MFDDAGAIVARGQCLRTIRKPVTTTPAIPDPSARVETLPGTWLYGGMLYAHFGHFLCESTGRLWALDHLDEPIDGVLFLPKKNVGRPQRFLAPIQPWLDIAGLRAPVKLAVNPTRVARLILPDQGFGTGPMITGAPEYRAFVGANFGANVAAEGAEKVYISRSRLFSKRGRILGEAVLERALAAEGYRIFHPQAHPIEEQIAQYKAARRIISTDCSALHLAAFFADPGDRIAIIARRPGAIIDDFTRQYRAFAGIDPLVISAITGLHGAAGTRAGKMNEVFSEIDHVQIHGALAAQGFVSGAAWPGPTADDVQGEIHALSTRLGAQLVPVDG